MIDHLSSQAIYHWCGVVTLWSLALGAWSWIMAVVVQFAAKKITYAVRGSWNVARNLNALYRGERTGRPVWNGQQWVATKKIKDPIEPEEERVMRWENEPKE